MCKNDEIFKNVKNVQRDKNKKKRYIYYVQLTCLMPNNPRIK